MMSVELSGLVLICNFFEETYFCHLHGFLLACFYEIHLKLLTSHIYFRLEETMPICKSRDDGADMRFRSSSATRNPNQGLSGIWKGESLPNPWVCVMFYDTKIC